MKPNVDLTISLYSWELSNGPLTDRLHHSRYLSSQKIVMATSLPLLVLPKNCNGYIIPVTFPPQILKTVTSFLL
jgi:hypothetical protein